MLKVRARQSVSMQTRDGVRLDADVYYPDAVGLFPVLLMRQPYGRAIASTVVYAHPTWYAAHGYIVVIQDVRGRGTSEGTFKLFAHEMSDGFDAVNWAAQLPGSTGQVGMYGFSYQGMTQLYAAATQPPALKALCPAMLGYDLFSDWAYEGGAFCWQANLGWAIQVAAETARRKGDVATHQTLTAAAKNLSLGDPVSTRSEILKDLDPQSFYHEWLDHPDPGDYWDRLSPQQYLVNVDLPMLHIGGWFDTFLRGTLHLYQEMSVRSKVTQHLLVGAWAHLPWSRKVGAVDYGMEAVSPCDRAQIRWFDQFLKGLDTGLLNEPSVRLFEMGSNQWRTFDTFPGDEQKFYFLATTGLASMSEQEGKLVESLPDACPTDVFVHDPWRPVPALGGHAAAPSGSFDRSNLDGRSDILTYTSDPLIEDLHLAGALTVEVWCLADTPSFDLCAVLSEVRPDGSVFNFSQGYITVKPNQLTDPLCITLQTTCIRIAKRTALRLSLSAACFPAYPVNVGTGQPTGETRLIDAQIITITVRCGQNTASQVRLSIAQPS